jgi:hypothetical protein
MHYSKEYLNDWYFGGGAQRYLSPSGSLKKATDAKWDAPTAPFAEYFEPAFSAAVQAYVDRSSDVFKLLPKTTYIAEGDSWKYYSADVSTLQSLSHASTPYTDASANTAGPIIASLEHLIPAYMGTFWETSLMSTTERQWMDNPRTDPAFLRKYHTEKLPHDIDSKLCQTVDTVNFDASNDQLMFIESIDRIISAGKECNATLGANTEIMVSGATDGDIETWRSGTIDRSEDANDIYGGGGDGGDGISIPLTADARYLTLDMIDDVMAAIKKYSKRKRYIALTGPKTMNELQKLIDPKQRFLNAPMDVQYTVNGVDTRPGRDTGFSVASFITNGLRVPFFESYHVANEESGNRSATVSDADIGNIYLIDLDEIEIRTAIPFSYLETPDSSMLTGDFMYKRHWIIYAAQLTAINFRAHGAVKYLKST